MLEFYARNTKGIVNVLFDECRLLECYAILLTEFFDDYSSFIFRLLFCMAVKQNNVLLNLITGCLYWLTTCFGQLHENHQVYKS